MYFFRAISIYIRILAVFCFLFLNCLVKASSIEEIEQELNQEQENRIDRKNLPTLEDKKKESSAGEIEINHNANEVIYKKKAKLIILNKITAKSELIEFKLGQIKFFGKISIEVNKCAKTTDPIKTSNLVFLTIFDNKLETDKPPIFHGWMDSANPSVSTLEHPVYEVISVDCLD